MDDKQYRSDERPAPYFQQPWRLLHRLYEVCLIVVRVNKLVNHRMSRVPPQNGPSNVTDIRHRMPPNPPEPPPPSQPPPPGPPGPPPWHWQPGAIVLLIGLGLLILGGYLEKYSHRSTPTTEKTYQTAANESRTQQLPDGTVLSLGAESEVHLQYTEKRRVVQHLRGEATFDVADDAARPFIVSTFLVDLEQGTKFRVEVGATVRVAVHDGILRVRRRGSKPGSWIEVLAGATYRVLFEGFARAGAMDPFRRMHACHI